MHSWFRPILWVGLLVGAGLVRAQAPLPADGSFSAKGHTQYLTDSSGSLTVTDVWRMPLRFNPVSVDIPQFNARHQPHWLRSRVFNATSQPQSLVAEIDYPFLESVEFYLLTSTGRLLTHSESIGWSTSVKNRPLAHQNPLFQFTLTPHQSAWLYLRATGGKMRLTVPLRLHTADGFVRADRSQRLFWDCITGMMGVILLLSLFLFIILHDRIYAIYGLYMLASWLYLIGNEGYLLVWLNLPRYGLISAIDFPIVNMYLAIVVSFWLIRTYILSPVIHYRWLRRIYQVSIAGPVLAIGLLLADAADTGVGGWPAAVVHLLEPICYMIPLLLMVSILVYLTQRRAAPPESAATGPARLYLLAISPPLLQVVLGFLRERNLIPDQFISREGAALTTLLEFIILMGALGYRYKRIADERRILVAEAASQRQQLLETQLKAKQEELRTTQAQLRLQEEKERIARDLHDHVGAQLSVIAANANAPGLTAETSALIGNYAREAMQSLRDTVWAIDQSALTLADFGVKLRQYLNRQQQQHPACAYFLDLDATTNPELTSTQALNLFRQVQEAVHNAFKHAQASQVRVRCHVAMNQFTLTICDNGVGFDLHSPTDGHPHYGLRNLQRRAAEMQGECCIDSELGQGTRVSVTIPLTR